MNSAPMRERDCALRAPAGHRAPERRPSNEQNGGDDRFRLVVKRQGGVALLPLTDIECLEADGNAVVVHTADGSRYRIRESLSSLYEQLTRFDFVRIHRGTVVRTAAIAGIEKGRFRKAFAVLRSGAKFEIGRVEFQRLRVLWQPGLLDLHALSTGLQLLPTSG